MFKVYYIKNIVKSYFLIIPFLTLIYGLGYVVSINQSIVAFYAGVTAFTIVNMFLIFKVLHLYERISQLEEEVNK